MPWWMMWLPLWWHVRRYRAAPEEPTEQDDAPEDEPEPRGHLEWNVRDEEGQVIRICGGWGDIADQGTAGD